MKYKTLHPGCIVSEHLQCKYYRYTLYSLRCHTSKKSHMAHKSMIPCLLFLHYKHSLTMHRTFAAWALILCSFSSVHAICMFSSHLTMKPVTWNVTVFVDCCHVWNRCIREVFSAAQCLNQVHYHSPPWCNVLCRSVANKYFVLNRKHFFFSYTCVCMHKRMAKFLSYMYACTHT